MWGLQEDLADELERELSFTRASTENKGELLDYDDAISLTSSDPAASALLGYTQEEQEMFEGEEVDTELSQSSCPAYEELLKVIEQATARLDLPWKQTKIVAPQGVSMSSTFLAITPQFKSSHFSVKGIPLLNSVMSSFSSVQFK